MPAPLSPPYKFPSLDHSVVICQTQAANPLQKAESKVLKRKMNIPSTISSSLTYSNSSKTSLINTFPRPPPKASPPTHVEFWYDDEDEEDEEYLPMLAIDFLEECGVCKRRLGAGLDAYMCGGEAVFCSEECREEWMDMKEYFDVEKRKLRTVMMRKKKQGAVGGERRDLIKKTCCSFKTDPAAEISRAGRTLVAS